MFCFFNGLSLVCVHRRRERERERERERGKQREKEGGRGGEGEEKKVSIVFLLLRTLVPYNQGYTLTTSFNINYFLRGPISKYSHIGVYSFNT